MRPLNVYVQSAKYEKQNMIWPPWKILLTIFYKVHSIFNLIVVLVFLCHYSYLYYVHGYTEIGERDLSVETAREWYEDDVNSCSPCDFQWGYNIYLHIDS